MNTEKNTAHKAELFTDCCDLYYYQEYYDICLKNPDKSDEDNFIEFINQHIKKAHEQKDHCSLISAYETKGYLYNVYSKDFEKGLDEVLKEFSMRVNPVYLSKKYYKYYEPLSYSINTNIISLSDKLSSEFIKTHFEYIWDSFEFEKEITSKEEALSYLEEMMKNKNAYKKINKKNSIR